VPFIREFPDIYMRFNEDKDPIFSGKKPVKEEYEIAS